jgi:hypothetical protein
MQLKELEARISQLEDQVRVLQDIEAIKKLQRAYGYYLEHWMYQEVVDCFSDSPDAMLDIWVGKFVGKKGIKRFFETIISEEELTSPELLHQVMQIAGIVDIEPDGQTARGRWQGWGVIALPRGGGIENFFIHGIYQVEYVKEGGKWKFKTLQFNRTYSLPPGEGLVKPERLVPMDPNKIAVVPDLPRSVDPSYPTGYIVPFHFKHPVTSEVTSEGKRNASRQRKS